MARNPEVALTISDKPNFYALFKDWQSDLLRHGLIANRAPLDGVFRRPNRQDAARRLGEVAGLVVPTRALGRTSLDFPVKLTADVLGNIEVAGEIGKPVFVQGATTELFGEDRSVFGTKLSQINRTVSMTPFLNVTEIMAQL